MSRFELIDYFKTAFEKLGPQSWWPGETPFEVCVGAILTQNTSWANVEKAIANLKKNGLLDLRKMYALEPQALAELIRSAGYFNIKTRRLRNFLKVVVEDYDGDLEALFDLSATSLREKLLSIPGIGPETADSIALYAALKPAFVVDAYTRRIFVRHEVLSEEADYHQIQEHLARHLPEDRQLFNEFHALIVAIGKTWCRPKNPDCEHCPWQKYLPEKI